MIICEKIYGQFNHCLWVVDLELEVGVVYFCSGFIEFDYLSEKETVLSISTEGWVQTKCLKYMMPNANSRDTMLNHIAETCTLTEWKKVAYVPA